jgi:hypothetical protein
MEASSMLRAGVGFHRSHLVRKNKRILGVGVTWQMTLKGLVHQLNGVTNELMSANKLSTGMVHLGRFVSLTLGMAIDAA